MKTALITGATSGIGEASAKLLAANDYNLLLTGRRKDKLESLARLLSKKNNVDVHYLSFDIRSRSETEKALYDLPPGFESPDLLLNNAGLASGISTIQDGDVNDWETMIDTNVKGLLYVSRHIAKRMSERKAGHIINIGSIAGKEVYPNGNVYCATKFAVEALTRAMRIDLLPFGVRVTSISPGMVETEFSLVRFHGDSERANQVYNGVVPLKPEDIAEAVLWVANRPPHVNINDIVIMPTVQASTSHLIRK